MIKAIYKARDDGDYDFVAAFETDCMPEGVDWVEEVKEFLGSDNEEVLIVSDVDLHNLTEVLEVKQ